MGYIFSIILYYNKLYRHVSSTYVLQFLILKIYFCAIYRNHQCNLPPNFASRSLRPDHYVYRA